MKDCSVGKMIKVDPSVLIGQTIIDVDDSSCNILLIETSDDKTYCIETVNILAYEFSEVIDR